MALKFQTEPQEMIFVDPSVTPPTLVNAEALQPNHTYNVFVTVANFDNFEYTNVQVSVVHSPFGIGAPGGTAGLTQPLPVNIAPAFDAAHPGLATIQFSFTTPAGGHGCITATIEPDGPSLGQNTTVYGAPIGAAANTSFLVFGGTAAETMILQLTESLNDGSPIPAGTSWTPLLVAPPGAGPSNPAPAPIALDLAANLLYSVGLDVTIPASATAIHKFNIKGFVAGIYVGEVDIVINPLPAGTPPPDPYVAGGYQSADIILVDPYGTIVPLGGGSGPWDTLLLPDTDYQIMALVHNDSPTAAVNTVVRFWSIPGGLATAAVLIDVQTATVPGNGSVLVTAAHPYHSAPAGEHECAAISIYNAQSGGCAIDASTAAQIPDPNANVGHSCSAWRNTDSISVFIHEPWQIFLEATEDPILVGPNPGPDPVIVNVHALLAPAGWELTPHVAAMKAALTEAGAAYPLHLLTALRQDLTPADLGIKIEPRGHGIRVEQTPGTATHDKAMHAVEAALHAPRGKHAPFLVKGIIPKTAKPGDLFIVTVTANYPKTAHFAGRAVQFTQMIHVRQ